MKSLKTFESFNDPNNNPVEKVSISSYITKSDFFSLKKKKEKEFIKSIIGKEFKEFSKDNKGDYNIQTGDLKFKELNIPKKFIFEIKQKV